ncbi:MAG TPA: glycosyltransferase [Cryobacterium sp.]|nr:glycosyltransferase [Cryobacterium sp.]
MTEWTTIQNLVFPLENDPDVLSLYIDAETWARFGDTETRVSDNAHIDDLLSRQSIRIGAGQRVSFASYFNAFPASYWQHWTTVRSVRLLLETEGAGTLMIYRSTAHGIAQRVESHTLSGSTSTAVDLPVLTFGDGGWYWFDIVAGTEPLVVTSGSWATQDQPARTGKVSLGITTFNKAEYCIETLGALADSGALLGEIDRIFLVDQGTDKVSGQDAYPGVAASLGAQLEVIEQPNLGGSGGFARSMAETLDRPESDFVLLLDDDVKIEPESIFRALQFGRFSRRPVLVGGHMFDLLDRPVLHAFAETIDLKPFVWHSQPHEKVPHDFRFSNLRQTRWMHARMDADYNGWWFCLIPTEVVRSVGLSLPAFIKWDDAEYCLRAGANGFPTVSLPGAALWHVSWLDKDDSIDWQAYFHARNRFVAALLHSPFTGGGSLLRDSRIWDIKHLLSMQYYPVALRQQALRDVLSGPAHMHRTMPTKLAELRAQAADFPEKRILKTDAETPVTNEGKRVYPIPAGTQQAKGPRGLALVLFTAQMVARHWLTKPAPENVERPQVELSKRDGVWFRLPYFDSALVSTADGTGKTWYSRDRKKFRRMLRESWRLHREIGRRWPELARQYRDALPEITSVEEWNKTLGR